MRLPWIDVLVNNAGPCIEDPTGDHVKRMIDMFHKDGSPASYDLGPKLLNEIDEDKRKLYSQYDATLAFGKCLLDTGRAIKKVMKKDAGRRRAPRGGERGVTLYP